MHQRLLTATALMGLVLVGLPAWAQAPTRPANVSLGLAVEPTPEGADQPGIVVREVVSNGPAARAGVRPGDVIVRADGTEVRDFDTLVNTLARHKPGDKLTLRVRRDGKDQDLTVTLGDRMVRQGPGGFLPVAFLGVQTRPLTPEVRTRLGITVEQGALVTEVVPNTPAASAGLRPDDVITALNNNPIAGPPELRAAVQQAGVGKEITLKVARGKETTQLKAKLEEVPSDLVPFTRPGLRPGGFPEFPSMPGFGEERRRVDRLERQVQELEKRVRELEQRQGSSGKK